MPKRTEHEWKEAEEGGGIRRMRASRVAGQWRLSSKGPEDLTWNPHESPSEEDLRGLREVLWRKYQRRRLPWEHVREIDRLLGEDEP